jgi:hypothetical protein
VYVTSLRVAQRIDSGPNVRAPQQKQQFQSEMEEARRRYVDDEQARQETFARIYSQHKPSKPSMWGCWLQLLLRAALSLAIELPALWSPLRQGIPDRLAETVVVLEPRGGLVGRVVARLS